jgi:hypothetical protein
VENPPPAYVPDTLNTCQPRPPADRLSIFSDLDAVSHIAHMHVQAHMRVQHKLGPKSKRFKPSVQKVLHKYQELIKEGIVQKDISKSFWKNASVTSGEKKKMSCSAAQI